ncbi:glutaredoxin family protein [Permianibacter sp. IMCC34836]|uniref:glutaredoxin family protein n=1 Tax=Permianibacter fluminis TaxID=2738515 RepID=UPI001553DEDA|nr:glutaredoxin family protein [Permianibacter fluminis]NQD38785.1 glutaredoxin family protein [Permianibacter fluminis]
MTSVSPSPSSVQLTLFGTLGCHLCEQAQDLLQPMLQQQGWQLSLCDIAEQADSDQLISRYGLRIPVLQFAAAELDWPFTAEQVQAWVSQAVVSHGQASQQAGG